MGLMARWWFLKVFFLPGNLGEDEAHLAYGRNFERSFLETTSFLEDHPV